MKKKIFLRKEDDVFNVASTNILGKLPAPNVTGTSDRYIFDKIIEALARTYLCVCL